MKKRLQRSFIPLPEVEERLAFADEKLNLFAGNVINEVLKQHLKEYLEKKVKQMRDSLSAPIP